MVLFLVGDSTANLRLRAAATPSKLCSIAELMLMQSQVNTPSAPSRLRTILIGRRPAFTLVRVVVLVAAVFIVFKFVVLPIRIMGPSMLPTYKEGRINFISRLAYKWHEPRRGDVVGIRFAGHTVMLMKRVVGLPGETVEFRNGKLLVNGEILDEPYVTLPCNWTQEPRTLKADEYFVVGDNRSMNLEDHDFGRAARDRIVGKVLL